MSREKRLHLISCKKKKVTAKIAVNSLSRLRDRVTPCVYFFVTSCQFSTASSSNSFLALWHLRGRLFVTKYNFIPPATADSRASKSDRPRKALTVHTCGFQLSTGIVSSTVSLGVELTPVLIFRKMLDRNRRGRGLVRGCSPLISLPPPGARRRRGAAIVCATGWRREELRTAPPRATGLHSS